MIRSYKKNPVKIKNPNYQRLLILTIKEKYFSLFVGILVAFSISTIAYQTFFKNTKINLAFKLPTFSLAPKVVKKEVVINKSEKTYVVAEGDDLWHIAEKFYGSGFNAYDISLSNKILDSSNISAGQKLIIPKVTPRQPTVGDISATATSQVTYVEDKYIVQPGDSLSIIAQKVYGDLNAWTQIMAVNNLTTPDNIEAGMVLVIPR